MGAHHEEIPQGKIRILGDFPDQILVKLQQKIEVVELDQGPADVLLVTGSQTITAAFLATQQGLSHILPLGPGPSVHEDVKRTKKFRIIRIGVEGLETATQLATLGDAILRILAML